MILPPIFDEKRKLLMGLTVLLAVGFIITSLASFFVSRQSVRHEIVANELPLTTDNIYSEIQKDLIRPVFVSSMMARDTYLRDWVMNGEMDTSKVVRYLKEIQQKYGAMTSFFVSENSRKYYYESGILKTVSTRDAFDSWYFRVRGISAPYEMNLDTDEAHNRALTLFVNYRVLDYNNKLIGITGVGLPLNAVRDLIEQYQTRYKRTVYMTDRQGRIMLHSSGLDANDIHAIPGLATMASSILQHQSGAYSYVRNGYEHLLNVRFIPELGWYLFVEKSEKDVYADIYRTLFFNLGICAAITAIVALLTSISIGQHQSRLKKAAEEHTKQLNAALSEAGAANRAKSQMLAYVGHDLRTPLVNISHYLHQLHNDSGESFRQYQSTIEQSIVQQLLLIDELVEYARGELDHLELLPAPTYLYSFLHDVASQCELLAIPQGNHFAMVLTDDLPSVAVFDAVRLRQVLLNLLSNAAKFTFDGEIRLLVQASPLDEKFTLRFMVTDTGSGIPKEDQQRIFLPFERSKSERQGSGLGLAIAYQIVQKMGGDLKIDSTLGQGSTFWFELAMDAAQESEVLQSVQLFALPELFGSGKRVLIVETNPSSRDYLHEALSLADFDVVTADHESAVLALGMADKFDVVMTDHLENQAFLQRLRDYHRESPPIRILTSCVPPQRHGDLPDGLDFQATLLKPISADFLLQSLKDLLTKTRH
jgi:signal transduction histidine kinase/CheY-like chemotaxis protein